jgi:hypothetical protein
VTDPFTRRSRDRTLTAALAEANRASEALTEAAQLLPPGSVAEKGVQAARLTLYPAIDQIRYDLTENRKKEL